MTLLEFIEETVYMVDNDECWIWQNAKDQNGYGMVCIGHSKMDRAYKVAYVLVYGEVPKGLELEHTCETRLCWNPKHLKPVTHLQNMSRARGSGKFGWKQYLTHCKRNHEFTFENTLVTKLGHRQCRKCKYLR